MNSARICLKCNWEHPTSYTKAKCRLCSTILSMQLCNYCNEWLSTDLFLFKSVGTMQSGCKPCRSKVSAQYDRDNPEQSRANSARMKQNRRLAAEKKYEEWLVKIDKPFVPLKEEQWLETCKYFGGCAMCGKEHIESRQFFVQFEEGGRYTPWNMFPTCAACARHPRLTENPFAWIDGAATRKYMTEERRIKLTEFFILQIERVT